MTTDIEQVQGALTRFDTVSSGIAELKAKYGGVLFEVTTTKGMEAAREARRAVREPRIEVEKIRKEAKAPLLAIGKRLDSEAKRITALLLEIETPIDEAIGNEETRKEREKEARIAAELARVNSAKAFVAELRAPQPAFDATPESILEDIAKVDGVVIGDDLQEFRQEAQEAKFATLSRLRLAHRASVQRQEEQAELAKLRAANAAREAEEASKRAEEAERERQQREQQEREQRERAEAERKAQAEATAKRDTALAAIREIQHASTTILIGRGHLKPRSVELADALIAEVEALPMTEAKYGEFLEPARTMQTATLDDLRAKRHDYLTTAQEQRQRAEARQRQAVPGAAELVSVLEKHYGQNAATVRGWLSLYDWRKEVAA